MSEVTVPAQPFTGVADELRFLTMIQERGFAPAEAENLTVKAAASARKYPLLYATYKAQRRIL